jgi:hypothetical protein
MVGLLGQMDPLTGPPPVHGSMMFADAVGGGRRVRIGGPPRLGPVGAVSAWQIASAVTARSGVRAIGVVPYSLIREPADRRLSTKRRARLIWELAGRDHAGSSAHRCGCPGRRSIGDQALARRPVRRAVLVSSWPSGAATQSFDSYPRCLGPRLPGVASTRPHRAVSPWRQRDPNQDRRVSPAGSRGALICQGCDRLEYGRRDDVPLTQGGQEVASGGPSTPTGRR